MHANANLILGNKSTGIFWTPPVGVYFFNKRHINMAKKYLITSALPYVNGELHLGHLIGCWLPSDVYARFCRACGRDVLYVCGADEHGTPAVVGAAAENMPVIEYNNKYSIEIDKKEE